MRDFQAVIEKVLQEAEKRREDRLQAIIQAGGTASFLTQARMPRLASALAEVAPEAIVGCPDETLRCMEDRLEECERCSEGGVCDLPGALEKGAFPACEGGRLVWRRCEKWPEYAIRRDLAAAGVGARFLGCTLENFRPHTKTQEKALSRLRRYVASLPTDRGLFIAGPVGTGKTHLAVGVLRAARELRGIGGRFAMVPAVLAQIRAAIGRGDEDAAYVLETYQQTPLLVLDDIGAERVTDWVREQLFLLIDARYQAMLPTLVTTNDSLETLEEHVGQRIVSRIMGMCDGIVLDGPDYRKGV